MGLFSSAVGQLEALRKKEVLAGSRLPYRALLDENVMLLDDGSVMMALHVPGIGFETADSAELNAQTATREIMFRSALDARFIFYHHIIRRRVDVGLNGHFRMCWPAILIKNGRSACLTARCL